MQRLWEFITDKGLHNVGLESIKDLLLFINSFI